jgi:hypothetical protein
MMERDERENVHALQVSHHGSRCGPEEERTGGLERGRRTLLQDQQRSADYPRHRPPPPEDEPRNDSVVVGQKPTFLIFLDKISSAINNPAEMKEKNTIRSDFPEDSGKWEEA